MCTSHISRSMMHCLAVANSPFTGINKTEHCRQGTLKEHPCALQELQPCQPCQGWSQPCCTPALSNSSSFQRLFLPSYCPTHININRPLLWASHESKSMHQKPPSLQCCQRHRFSSHLLINIELARKCNTLNIRTHCPRHFQSVSRGAHSKNHNLHCIVNATWHTCAFMKPLLLWK